MRKNLDIFIGIAGCLAGLALASIMKGYGLAIFAISAFYLLFRKRFINSPNPSLPDTKTLRLILNIIFFLAVIVSLLLMHYSLHRPLLYFVLTTLAVAALASEILSSKSKNHTNLLLLKILLIAFSLRYGLLYDFPGLYGVDPWAHSMYVEDWIRMGYISDLSWGGHTEYSIYPGMHLNIMAMRIITEANPKDSLFLSIGLFYILSILFTFLLGQRLSSTRVGLLAALFVSIEPHHVVWGAWLIPTSVGVAILAMLLWLIFKRDKNISNILLIILTSLFIIISHTLSAFIIGMIFVVLLGVYNAYNWVSRITKEKISLNLYLVILFWIGMFILWIYGYYAPGVTFSKTIFGWLFETLQTDAQFIDSASLSPVTVSDLLNRVWFFMLIGFIVLGSLHWLSIKSLNGTRIAIIGGVIMLLIVAYGTPMFNIFNLRPERWLSFMAVLVAPLAVEGILTMSKIVSGDLRKSIVLVLVVLVFCLFAINNDQVNPYTPLLGRAYMADPDRYFFNTSELSAVHTISEVYDGIITTDSKYATLPFSEERGISQLRNLFPGNENKGLVVIRKHLSHGSPLGTLNDQFRNEFLNSFNSVSYNKVYDNGEVKAQLPR